MNRGLIAGAVVVGLAGGLVLWRVRARPGLCDTAQITNLILDVKRGVEGKRAREVLRRISEDYDDGVFTKRDLTRLAISGFREPGTFNVHVEAPEIEVSGDRAQARLRAEFWIGRGAGESKRQRLDLQVEFVKRRGRWEITRATGWESAMDAAE